MGKTAQKNQKKPTRIEFSSGGVVYRNENNGYQILLIKDSYGKWALPKGKMEKGETKGEAAKREIREETGIEDLKIIKYLGRIKYFFKLKGQPIKKTVYVFLLKTEQTKLNPSSETKGAKWFKPKEAKKTIFYKKTAFMLQRAINFIQQGVQ